MEWLAELFETNRIIVLSIYGQVFFVLGLAVALQSRQRSELPSAVSSLELGQQFPTAAQGQCNESSRKHTACACA